MKEKMLIKNEIYTKDELLKIKEELLNSPTLILTQQQKWDLIIGFSKTIKISINKPSDVDNLNIDEFKIQLELYNLIVDIIRLFKFTYEDIRDAEFNNPNNHDCSYRTEQFRFFGVYKILTENKGISLPPINIIFKDKH